MKLVKVDEWIKNVWPELRRHCKNENIYNGDETEIFYSFTPDKTLDLKRW